MKSLHIFHADWLQIFRQDVILHKENLDIHAIQSLNINFVNLRNKDIQHQHYLCEKVIVPLDTHSTNLHNFIDN